MGPHTEIYPDIFNNECIESITLLENSFTLLSYDDHVDEIYDTIHSSQGTGNDIKNDIIIIYIDHINRCLNLQGVFLNNDNYIDFGLLSEILSKITLIGSGNGKEILSTVRYDIMESPLEQLAKILSDLIEIDFGKMLLCLNRVSDNTMDVINEIYKELNTPIAIDMLKYKNRLLKYGNINLVKDIINDIGVLGYDFKTIVLRYRNNIISETYKYDLEERSRPRNVDDKVNLLYLLALGSSLDTSDIKTAMLSVSDLITNEDKDIMEININISKLSVQLDENI